MTRDFFIYSKPSLSHLSITHQELGVIKIPHSPTALDLIIAILNGHDFLNALCVALE